MPQVGVGGYGGGTGVVDPSYRPPKPKPPFTPPPTGIDPTKAVTSQPDPRISQLMTQLAQQQTPTFAAPNPQIAALTGELAQSHRASAGNTAQSGQLQALLGQLMRGEGVATPNVANDPEARAYRVAKLREEQLSRGAEADRLGASGVAGSGAFDARLAQLREATGEDIASQTANIAGRRRGEAIQGAVQGAQLTLADLERQRSSESQRSGQAQGLLNALLGQEASARDAALRQAEGQRGSQQQLLSQLLAEQGRVQGLGTETAFRQEDVEARRAETERAEKERRRLLYEDTQERGRAASAKSLADRRAQYEAEQQRRQAEGARIREQQIAQNARMGLDPSGSRLSPSHIGAGNPMADYVENLRRARERITG